MIIFGNNMLVQVFLSLLLLESVYAAGPVIPMRRKRSRWSMPPAGSFISMKRASCYHDVAFYYNAALLARPKSETAWLEPWVRGAWGHHVKHFGGCAVPRINTGTSGTRCENFGAPKPLVVFLFLSNAAYISWAGNFLYCKAASGRVKDLIGKEMGVCSEVMTHGTFNEWTGTAGLWAKANGFSHFPLFDFYHQIGDIVSRDRWYNQRKTHAWFLFFHGVWLETGQNLLFLTNFWNYYALYYSKWWDSSANVWDQVGIINIGEAIHFLSAAVGRNLTATAASRFTTNWKPLNYSAAVAQYPALT